MPKISELVAAAALAGTEKIVVLQSGVAVATTVSELISHNVTIVKTDICRSILPFNCEY